MVVATSDSHDSTIDYGVDAAGVMAMLLGIGGVGVVAGAGLGLYAPGPILRGIGVLVALAALAPACLGIMMGAYAVVGKRRFRDWMMARHAWRGDERVLDVGAGRGLVSIAAARRLSTGTVVAIDVWRQEDLTANGPEALRANVEAAGVATRVQIETMDARALDLTDASIDVVMSVLCLHNIEPAEDRERALREIARVLKPGGVAYLADYTGAKSYAAALAALGLDVTGPIDAMPVALSLMALVEARKPVA